MCKYPYWYVWVPWCVCICTCVWCLETRQQSNSSQGVQKASSHSNCMMKDWETTMLHACTHTHTNKKTCVCMHVCMCLSALDTQAISDMWLMHVILEAKLNSPGSYCFFILASNENRIFLQKLVLSLNSQSIPTAGKCARALWEQSLIYVLKAITISWPWMKCCFLLMKAVFLLISFPQLW